MSFCSNLTELIPKSPEENINWAQLESIYPDGFEGMKETPQNPVFHGEGNVFEHTKMVCSELVMMPSFHELPDVQKIEVFLAALLHDIGKTRTTKMESGQWTSPNHASVGSRMVREFLWKKQRYCGTKEKIQFREAVCALIRNHMQPVHIMDHHDSERRLIQIASYGESLPDFTWDRLCLLSEADVKGRISKDTEESVLKVDLCRMLATETGCLNQPYNFTNPYTKHAYLSGREIYKEDSLFDNTWGEVIMMSGLPGTGKDTWIKENFPNMPVISLDDIRQDLQIKPTENQSQVIQTAKEQARAWLRERRPFIWNATNLIKETRQIQINLFEQYGARVRIVYLETDWELCKERNKDRFDAVPEASVEKMLSKIVPPTPDEAQVVEWYCV